MVNELEHRIYLPNTIRFNARETALNNRNGIVGQIDAPAGGVMILSFPRVKMFYKRGDEEVELSAARLLAETEKKALRFSPGLSRATEDFRLATIWK